MLRLSGICQDILDLELKVSSKSTQSGMPDRLVVHRKGVAPAQGQDALAYSLHTSPRAHQVRFYPHQLQL